MIAIKVRYCKDDELCSPCKRWDNSDNMHMDINLGGDFLPSSFNVATTATGSVALMIVPNASETGQVHS